MMSMKMSRTSRHSLSPKKEACYEPNCIPPAAKSRLDCLICAGPHQGVQPCCVVWAVGSTDPYDFFLITPYLSSFQGSAFSNGELKLSHQEKLQFPIGIEVFTIKRGTS